MPLRLSALVAAVAAVAFAAPPASAALHLSPIGTDFSSPVYVTAPPGDPHRLYVVERGGKISRCSTASDRPRRSSTSQHGGPLGW